MTISAVSVLLPPGTGLVAGSLALLSGLVCGLHLRSHHRANGGLLPTALALVVSPELSLKVIVLRRSFKTVRRFADAPVAFAHGQPAAHSRLNGAAGLGALLGLPGVLLALPLVVVLQVLLQEIFVKETGPLDLSSSKT